MVCRAKRRCPRTLSRTTDANLYLAFLENILVFDVREIAMAQPPPPSHDLPMFTTLLCVPDQ